MSVPMSQVLSTTRTYMNDDNNTVFTDPVLIPKIQEAHREMQEELWIAGSPIVRAQSDVIAYVATATALPSGNWPPIDFLCPTALFENAALSLSTATGWVPMTEAIYIPLGAAQGTTLSVWCWQQENIILLGSTMSRSVIVQYRRQITVPVIATDLIGVLFGESYLAARAAAMAAGSVAGYSDIYTAMTTLAKENLAKVIVANRGHQKPLIRP